jgi:tetratricopeptide (TPR) repeat protein
MSMLHRLSSGGGLLAFSFASICAFFLLALFAFVPVSGFPFYHTKGFLIGIGAIVSSLGAILLLLSKRSLVLPPLTVLIALWIIPAAYGASLLLSTMNLNQGFFGNSFETSTVSFLILGSLLATVVSIVVRTPTHFYRLGSLLFIAMPLFLLIHIGFFVYGVYDNTLIMPTTNTVGTSLDYAQFLGAMLIMMIMVIRFFDLSSLRLAVVALMSALSVGLLVLLQFTMVNLVVGFFALLIALSSVYELLFARRRRVAAKEGVRYVFNALALSLSVVIILVGSIAFSKNIAEFSRSLDISLIDARPSLSSSLTVAEHTLARTPLWGMGPNSYKEQWAMFKDKALNETSAFWNIDFAEGYSYMVTQATTLGFIGVIAWLLFTVVVLLHGHYVLVRRPSSESLVRALQAISFVGILYVTALMLVTSVHHILFLFFFVCVGLFVSLLRFKEHWHEHSFSIPKRLFSSVGFLAVSSCVVVGISFLAYSITTRYIAAVYVEMARTEINKGSIDSSMRLLTTSLLIHKSDEALRLASGVSINAMSALMVNKSIDTTALKTEFSKRLNDSVALAQAAVKTNPLEYENHLALARAYQFVVPLRVDGAYDGAYLAYEQAILRNPQSPALLLQLATLELDNGNTQGAEQRLLEALALKSDYTEAIVALAQLKITLGQKAQAIEAARRVAEISPNDPTAHYSVGILYALTQSPSEALKAFSQAVALYPQFANALYMIAVTYASEGKYAEAIQTLEYMTTQIPEHSAIAQEDISVLQKNTNPFTASRLRTIGLPEVFVSQEQAEVLKQQ